MITPSEYKDARIHELEARIGAAEVMQRTADDQIDWLQGERKLQQMRIAELETENERLKEESIGNNHWIIDLQEINKKLETANAALEAQLAEANRERDEARLDKDAAIFNVIFEIEEITRERDEAEAQLAEAQRHIGEHEAAALRLIDQLGQMEVRAIEAEAQLVGATETIETQENVISELMDSESKLRAALRELDWHNPLHHDFDAYCHDLAQWGMGKADARPDPAEYGLKLLIPIDALDDALQAAKEREGKK